MAKQAAGTHQPLGYRAHVRLRALHKNLHSRFHAVRIAAAKEIQAILHKKRGLQNRLREWAVKTTQAGVRKVTPSRLHGPLRIKARAPQGSSQKREAPVPAGQWRRHQPLTDHVLTRAELRQRTRDAKQARRNGQPAAQPARKPDAMQQAQDAMRQAHARPAPQPSDADMARTHRTEAQRARTEHDFAGAQEHERRAEAAERKAAASPVPSLPGHPEAVQRAAQDHEKGRWAGLRKRTGDAPERTRSSRTRNRTTA